MDVLEGRVMPSTLTVMNNADSGAGSLRAAIAQAASGDTIVFKNSVHNIGLTSGELDIAMNLDIEGPGADKLTINGNNASRVFDIGGSATVTVAGLTVTNGREVVTTEGDGGGGILNDAGATLNLSQCALAGNQAWTATGSGFDIFGGGLLNKGTAVVKGTLFAGNQALNGGDPASPFNASSGGAIDNFEGGTLTVSACSFTSNQALGAPGTFRFAVGGAIESDAGAFNSNPSTVTVSNSVFTNNLASGGANVTGQGGAVGNECIVPGLGTVTLSGCTITGNQAVGGGGGDGVTTGDSQADGGAIQQYQGNMNIVGCTIANNLALGGKNTMLSNTDPFAGGAFGGAIENNYASVLNISSTVLTGNTAQGGATAAGPGSMAVGGAISNSPFATMTMTNCIVAANSALAGHGGPGVNSLLTVEGGFAAGGGVDTSNNHSVATITGSIISSNQAIGGAGGSGNDGGDGLGGGLSVGWGTLVGFSPDGSSLTLSKSVVASNLALGGSGGAGANGGDGLGGGLWIGPSASTAVSASLIELNAAIGGLAGLGGSKGNGIGGGVYNSGMFSDDLLTLLAFNFASTSHHNQYP
jgi:hypothetical protein